MNGTTAQDRPLTAWLVFAAVSLVFFFLNLATFTSLGVVLFTMVAELHWSLTAAGFSFAFLGLACGLSSPVPAMSMKWLGGRITVCIGAVLLALGFFLCSIANTVFAFYEAMGFLGLGYSFGGNVPGVYLIAGWFERYSARMIGLYLMLGALGAAFGPPIVQEIVHDMGWRGHWRVMALCAGAIGLICLAVVRDVGHRPESLADDAPDSTFSATAWTPRQAVFTAQFLLVAAAMAGTMACVTTISSVAVNHLVKLGATPGGAALVLSAIATTATAVKAVSGWMSEHIRPKLIVAAGLALQAAGNLMLADAHSPVLQYAAALTFGTGWGFTYVAGTVVLLDYFGGLTGSKILSIVWFLTSIAAAGPVAAGMIADRYGTFGPIFIVYGALMFVLAIPIALMRRPGGEHHASIPLSAVNSALAGKVEII
jgi:MFS family permease